MECLSCVRLSTLGKKNLIFTTTLSGGWCCCCFVVVIIILILERRRRRPREVRNIAQGNKDTKNNQGWDANGLTPGPSLLTTVLRRGVISKTRSFWTRYDSVTLPYGNNSPGSQFWNQNPFSLLPYSCGVKKIICTVLWTSWRKALKKCSESPSLERRMWLSLTIPGSGGPSSHFPLQSRCLAVWEMCHQSRKPPCSSQIFIYR